MRWYLILLFLIFLLFFLPLPIKIKLCYANYKTDIFIYRFKIKIDNIKRLKYKKVAKHDNQKKFNIGDAKIILHNLNRSRLKPALRIKISLEYGIMDAAVTAISYGVISLLLSTMQDVLAVPFKLKRYSADVNLDFDRFRLRTEIKSIISINIVKIIYIVFILIKSLKTINKLKKTENNCT